MKSLIKQPWCVEPFVNLSHTTEGKYQLCCVASPDPKYRLTTEHISPIEFFNSDYMKEVRRAMIDHDIPPNIRRSCSSCIVKEKNKIQSRRHTMNEKYKDFNIEIHDDYSIDYQNIDYVNMKVLGNICNLKCLICSPTASSKIAAEYKKHKISPVDKSIQVPFDEKNKEIYFDSLSKILDAVNRFSLIGGEAFVHPNFNEMFDLISNHSNAKNLELFIITNGTIIPDYVLENTHKFKKIILIFSIDAIGDKIEYIRYGTKWKDLDQNFQNCLNSDINVGVTTAVQLLNIGYLDEIHDYLKSLNFDTSSVQWNNFVTYPSIFNAKHLPPTVSKLYLKKYKKKKLFLHDDIIKVLKSNRDNFTEIKQSINFIKRLDTIRNVNLIDLYPEFKEFY